jgi:hypothetical protein
VKQQMHIVRPDTPGRIRARMDVLEQFLKQAHPESHEAFRLHQHLAELGRQLAVLEAKAMEKSA